MCSGLSKYSALRTPFRTSSASLNTQASPGITQAALFSGLLRPALSSNPSCALCAKRVRTDVRERAGLDEHKHVLRRRGRRRQHRHVRRRCHRRTRLHGHRVRCAAPLVHAVAAAKHCQRGAALRLQLCHLHAVATRPSATHLREVGSYCACSARLRLRQAGLLQVCEALPRPHHTCGAAPDSGRHTDALQRINE